MRKALNHVVISLVIALMFVGSASANWFYQAMIDSRFEGDDNRRLLTDGDEGVVGVQVRSNLRLSRVTETSRINFGGIWRSARFDGEAENSSLDTDDQELYIDGEWNTERLQYFIDSSFLRQSSAVTELEDTGAFANIERRITKSIAPQLTYSLFENTNLIAGVNYRDVEFPNVVPVSLTEFDVRGANLGVTHSINERTQISLFYSYSIFESQNIGLVDFENDIDTSNVSFQVSKSWSERWQAFAGLGFRKSNFTTDSGGGITNRNDDTGITYEAGLTRIFETITLNTSATRQTEPSASGTLNERTSFSLNVGKSFTERLTLDLDFQWLENESVDEANNSNDREFWSSTLGVSYRLTNNWFITGEYRHRDQEFDALDETLDADSDAIIIGIRFNGQEKSI